MLISVAGRRAGRRLLVGLIGLAATAAMTLGAGLADAAGVIVYQCGTGICAVSSSGGAARTVSPTGTLAGVTADGATVSWVDSSVNLVQAPLAGGAAHTIYPRFEYAAPVMSPNGRAYLGSVILPSLGFFVYEYTAGGAKPVSVDSSVTSVSYGWLGSTPLVAHTGSSDYVTVPSRICRAAAGANCHPADAIVQETRGILAYPSGSADGSEIVATVGQGDAYGLTATGGGFLALYSASTGALIRNLTPTSDQYDAEPRFSPDGSTIVFERLANGGRPSQILTVPASGGTPTVVTNGSNPFYASAAGAGGKTNGGTTRANPLKHLKAAARHPKHGLAVRFTLSSTSRLTIVVRKGKRHLGTLHKRFRKGARTLTLTRVGRNRLHKGTRYTLTLSAPHAKPLTIRIKAR